MSESPTALSDDDAANATAEIVRLQQEATKQAAVIRELETVLDGERRHLARAHADIEQFVHWFARAEDERDKLKRKADYLEQSKPSGLAGWLHARTKHQPPTPEASLPYANVPGVEFTYYLNTSPYRIFREPAFTLKGWGFPRSAEPVTALRARVDDAEFFGTYGLDEPSVIAHFGPQPNNPKPGFKIIIQTPPGRHHLSLEAQVGGGGWMSFLNTPIWAIHSPQ